ncbi:MAG: N-acetyltransferase family protein [Actinomycetes bacterium]
MASAPETPDVADVTVRDAIRADLPAVAAIYTHYVLNTTTTFNTQVRTPAEWTKRFDEHVERGPYHLLVAERGGRVEGYVETQPFRPKPAYDPSVELSIYVAPDTTAGGVGRALFDALRSRLEAGDFHRLYSVIALPNDRSVRFHERVGFVHRGTLTEAGRKFGRYLDVAFYELALPDAPAAPEPQNHP